MPNPFNKLIEANVKIPKTKEEEKKEKKELLNTAATIHRDHDKVEKIKKLYLDLKDAKSKEKLVDIQQLKNDGQLEALKDRHD